MWFELFPFQTVSVSVVDVTRGLVCLQAGCPLRACCSFTPTLWGRLCLKETQRHPTTRRLTNATMLALPWAAGECASMHSALLSTQVRCPCNPLGSQQAGSPLTLPSPSLRADLTIVSFLLLSWVNPYFLSSHTGETGGAFLPPHSLFLRLPGVWSRHRPGHTVDQPLRGPVPVCHLWGAFLLAMHAALLFAL